MPSTPAMSMAAKARYGLADESGQRNSIRLAFGESEYIGIRMHADRLRCEYTRLTGASKPGTSRRYEFVVGAQNASSAGAWRSSPPMYARASCESPAYPDLSAISGVPSFQRDWCVCMPEPLSPKIGFGMNVTDFPAARATFLTTYLYVIT